MAITASSSVQSVTAGLYSQLQVQQAQRNAERADQAARALQVSARAAKATADRAQEGARNLQVQADQAENDAGRARIGVAALQSSAESRVALGARAERAAESMRAREGGSVVPAPVAAPVATQATPVTPPAVTAKPVINTDGQTTGALISVTA